MVRTDSDISFVCHSCEQTIRAPARQGGKQGQCPFCQRSVRVPFLIAPDRYLHVIDGDAVRSGTELRSLLQGLAVSFLFHLILLSSLALILMKSRELGRTVSITLFDDTEGTVLDPLLNPEETPAPIPAINEGRMTIASEEMALAESPTDNRVEQASSQGDGRQSRASEAASTSGSVDPSARFSPKVIERLAKQPAAKRGDYEIALFWEGISDLDLHVQFKASKGRQHYMINYADRGKPSTGFLDVDQNYKPPLVDEPIEHIRWNNRHPPSGRYIISIHGFLLRSETGTTPSSVPFTVEVKTPDGVRSFTGSVGQGLFAEVDTIEIESDGTVAVESNSRSSAEAAELLRNAKINMKRRNPAAQREALLGLSSIVRDYPNTEEAAEAEILLNRFK